MQTVSRKLRDLVPGERARVTGYEPGSQRYRNRLLALGVTRGTTVTLLKIAPMGDPVEIEVRDFHLSLRKAEADILLLESAEGARDER